ncbi:MAG: hypothetical protein FJ279_02950 [Planctomycetes bacterium]|nr:hypothetical protein [Planctomycetota bacterium]
MKAYEFLTKVTPDGRLEVPATLAKVMPGDSTVRVIVLVSETPDEEDAAWGRLTAEQFMAGYSDADAIYDKV